MTKQNQNRAIIIVLLLVLLFLATACVSHYTVDTDIDGKPYICNIRVDRNQPDRTGITHCVPGQLP